MKYVYYFFGHIAWKYANTLTLINSTEKALDMTIPGIVSTRLEYIAVNNNKS